jgi:putative ABC transport system permease protein
MMMFFENVRLAFTSLMANKMRALLTMLGIIIGISSVIAIMTVGNSLTIQVTDSMSTMGANNINVYLVPREAETETTEEGYVFKSDSQTAVNLRESDYISDDMVKNLCDTYPDEIYAISATSSAGSGQVLDGKKYANVTLTGVSMGEFVASNVKLSSGRFFYESEMEKGLMLGLISDKAVNNLYDGDEEAALGDTVNVYIGDKFYQVTIVGVYKYERNAMMFSMTADKDLNTNLYIPLRAAKEITHNDGYVNFTIVTSAGVDADQFASKVDSFFMSYYRNNRNFEVTAFSLASVVETMSTMMGSITKAIAIVAGIALLVGGIGVMNIMLVSITERTREIGTRKALGAPNSSIRMQFIVEAVVICIVGGIIGIIIGVTAGVLLANALGTPAAPSVFSIILSLSFSMAIGVFFGYYPANKAAKMDPIEALRYE